MLRSELIRLGQEATRKMEVGGRVGGWAVGSMLVGGLDASCVLGLRAGFEI
jgi:hypothetical protein